MVELVGYVGSLLVVSSLLMTRIIRLRVISLIGSATFLVYAVLIDSIPIAITNVVLIAINSTFLWKASRVTEWFSLLEVRPESLYLAEFMRFYEADMAEFQPDWDGSVGESDVAALVLRDMQPAMAIVGRNAGDGVMELRLDYAIPRFGDYKMGRFLYGSNSQFFIEKGFTTVVAKARTRQYVKYLERMGFVQVGENRFELALV